MQFWALLRLTWLNFVFHIFEDGFCSKYTIIHCVYFYIHPSWLDDHVYRINNQIFIFLQIRFAQYVYMVRLPLIINKVFHIILFIQNNGIFHYLNDTGREFDDSCEDPHKFETSHFCLWRSSSERLDLLLWLLTLATFAQDCFSLHA